MPPQSLPTSQVAWQLAAPSSPLEQHLKLNQTAPVPHLKANQTLIRVLSTSLNPADYKIPEIGSFARLMVSWPHTPGMDFVGRVWSTTLPASDGIKAGDLVFGKHDAPVKHGSLGQFSIVDGSKGLAHVPNLQGVEGVELDWFGSAGVTALTAYQVLMPALGTEPGQGKGKSVFINGGSGGTGVFEIQIAKHVLGCDTVVVSCSGANADLCKSLGADEVIDYRSQDVVQGLTAWAQSKGKKFDLIVDNVGGDPQLYWHSPAYLESGAKFLQIGGSPSWKAITDMAKIFLWPAFLGGGQRKFGVPMVKTDRDQLVRVGQWIKEGKIKGVVDSAYSLADAAKAFEKLKTGRSRGKIVVRVNEDDR